MGLGLIGTFIAAAVIAVAGTIAGADDVGESKGFLQITTAAQGIVFIAAAVLLASRVARPRLWHFGLRRTRFWPTVGWAAMGLVVYWILAITYSALIQTDAEQETLEDLGTKDGTVWLVGAALLVIVIAPIGEEFFFRGFFYRSLRTRLPVALAALGVGTVFGLVHAGSTPAEILPLLALLGVIFCLVYERTGSLFAVIALHALNNFIAFGVQTEEWGVAAIVFGVVFGACLIVPRLLRPTPAPA